MTLDLREEFRRAIVAPFVRGYARGETPNPCIACNGSFRFAELLAFAERAGAARLATGHYARIVRHRGRLLLARAADARKDQSYMLARLDPRFLDRLWFPLGTQTKDGDARRGRARRPRRRAAAREPGGVLPRRRRLPRLPRPARPRDAERGPIVDEDGRELGSHDGFWRFTPGPAPRASASRRREPLYALRTDAATNTVVVGPRDVARDDDRRARADGSTSTSSASTRSSATAPSRVAATVDAGRRAASPPARRARVRRRARPGGGALRGRRRRRRRPDQRVRSRRCCAYSSGDVVDIALAIFLILVGAGIAWVSLELGATLQRLSAFIKGTQEEVLPVINKVGTTVDHVNAQMEKVDQITDSAVDAADSADTAVRAVSLAITRPVQKVTGFAAGVTYGVRGLQDQAELAWRRRRGEGRGDGA